MKIKTKILTYLKEKVSGEGITKEKLAKELTISKNDRRLFYSTLTQMVKEKVLYRKNNGNYAIAEERQAFEGVLRTHRNGFGFIIVDAENEQDYFVRQVDFHGALDGDIVTFQKVKDRMRPDKPAAKVTGIKMRANNRQVGTVTTGNKQYFFLDLDNEHFNGAILLSKKENKHLVIGHKVVVVPEEYLKNNEIIARVVEVLGHVNEPGMDILSIVKQHDIETTFPLEVDEQVATLPSEVVEQDFAHRTDLRDTLTITIDGADAKDLDDAISLTKLVNGNFNLAVHIADVSYYVEKNSPIDVNALRRGTSVYLADRVIPMLPVQLSNGICSLHPQVDRLTITCEMEIDARGLIVNKRIFPSVIYSDERMTYDDVNKMLKYADADLVKKYQHIYPMLLEMEALAQILSKHRHENGSLDFAINEAKITVDQHGKAIDIKVRTQDVAEELIEQFMVVANEAVATYFMQAELPFIYRIHGIPKDVKLDAFRQVANNMGVNVSGIKSTSSVKPKVLQRLLENIQKKDEYNLLSTLLLRTMQKAEYATKNIGHFGLAIRNYTHFTSPIRRYPDLIVHRLIRNFIFAERQYQEENDKLLNELKEIAHLTSVAERRAVDCERAVTNMKMAEYMQNHIGEQFKGVISGVINSGIFVELENLVEGKVPIESLKDDYYMYIPEQLLLIGRRTKKQYRMGQKVEIIVESANKELSEIRFQIVSKTNSANKNLKQIAKKKTTKKKNQGYRNKRARGGRR